MRLVLLSPRLAAVEGGDEIRECVDERWGRLLSRAGFLGITATLAAPPDRLCGLADLAGVILTGGNDLATVSDSSLSRDRDGFELSLLASCAQAGLPVLGACRGAQLLAVGSGAALNRVDRHAGGRHGLEWTPGTRLGGWCRDLSEAGSYHRYAIAGLPPDWRVAAVAPDGGVEAFEHATRPWFGVMWHPEREPGAAEVAVRLLQRIFHG